MSRVAVVTGAASGIGAATADLLAHAGLRVAALDRDEPGLARYGTARNAVREDPGPARRDADAPADTARSGAGAPSDSQFFPVRCDVRDDAEVRRALDAVGARWGRVDVLVNAAGVLARADVEETTPEIWHTVLDINLSGTFRLVQAALPYLTDPATAGAKRVINVGSGAADRGYKYPAYTASKGGVVALTRQLAAELAPSGVTVNAINPGFIRTAINDDAWSDDAARERWEATIPLGRMGRPEEVAAAAAFLASESSSYITGQVIRVDGGRSAISPRPR